MNIPKYAITHAGVFHGDDVFATAFLKKVNPEIRWFRANDPEKKIKSLMDRYNIKVTDTIVYDVGGGEFDHHQKDTIEYRYPDTNALPYSSFGKIVRAFYPFIMSNEMYAIFDRELVIPIDYQDCKGRLFKGDRNELSHAISLFNPNWNEDPSDTFRNKQFSLAVNFASSIIDRTLKKCESLILSEGIVKNAMEKMAPNQGYMVLDQYVNYGSYVAPHPHIRWAIYPSIRGGFQVFSCGDKNLHNRDIFSPEEIAELSKMERCLFVHPAGFTASFHTLEDAVDYMKKVCMRVPIEIRNV